jgi:nitrogen fixation NifU-like protein
MMTQALKGKTVAEARELFEKFHHMLTEAPDAGAEAPDLGKLSAFNGVRRFPVRVKCATLPWHTLQAALKEGHGTVSTE